MNAMKRTYVLGAVAMACVAGAGCSEQWSAVFADSIMSSLGEVLATWLNSLLSSLTAGS